MAKLIFFHGIMSSGKSTLALQHDYNFRSKGQYGMLLTQGDRSGSAQITSRLGASAEAIEVEADTDLFRLVEEMWHRQAGKLDYVIVDEAQFLTPVQVDQLAAIVDELRVDVYAFGLLTNFRSEQFPGSKRLIELTAGGTPLQAEVICWCGDRAIINGRVEGGKLVKEGPEIVLGDTGHGKVYYVVLCHKHWRQGLAFPPS